MTTSAATASTNVAPTTPLAAALKFEAGNEGKNRLGIHLGTQTPEVFDGFPQEMDSLLRSASVLDLGWRGRIRVTGQDRVRWLNGMVTNTVQALPQEEGNYSFLLNSQGRIQGDCHVYRLAEDLLLDSSHDQLPVLLRHLEHYIIMDDVELEEVSGLWTALEIVGPKAPQILAALGVSSFPEASQSGNARLRAISIAGIDGMLVEASPVLVPRYELWLPPAAVLAVWEAATRSGAAPAGWKAAEALRVIEGTPLYGIDLSDRDLPQETGQMRALNFNKGCYLGQEIVERIRSRGKVHRQFRQFRLEDPAAPPPFDLHSADQVVGRITSAAFLPGPHLEGSFALGFLREEGMAGKEPLRYSGGVATLLEAPPHLAAG